MDDLKRIYREGETETKKTLRDADGHDLGDDLGNAGDEVRQGLGNLGDDTRRMSREGARDLDDATDREEELERRDY